MAAMNDTDKNKAARIFARKVFNDSNPADLNHADILAAVSALDAAFEGLPNAMLNQAQSVANNLNLALPDPFKSTATISEKSTLLAVWAGVKYGYLTSGGA